MLLKPPNTTEINGEDAFFFFFKPSLCISYLFLYTCYWGHWGMGFYWAQTAEMISVRCRHWFSFCLLLSSSHAALHQLRSLFPCCQASAPATLLSGLSGFILRLSPNCPSAPAPLLEHWESVCCTSFFFLSSPSSPQHRETNLPVDGGGQLVLLSQHRLQMEIYCWNLMFLCVFVLGFFLLIRGKGKCVFGLYILDKVW